MKYLFFNAFFLMILSIIFSTDQGISDGRFYYAYQEKIPLDEIENKLIVRFKTGKNSQNSLLPSSMKILAENDLVWRDDSTLVITVSAFQRDSFRSEVQEDEDVLVCNALYKTKEGAELGFVNQFIVKPKEGVARSAVEKLNAQYGVEILKSNDFFYILGVRKGENALELSNKYYESGLMEYSHPDFFADISTTQNVNDPYFINQFYLHNTGQVFTDGHFGAVDADIDAPEAWTVTTGSNNIIVAVLDEGVTSNHVDLPNTRQVRLNGSNFADGSANDPSPTFNGNHGNACAGIIGATHNAIGIAGIAPNVRIMPIRIFNSNGSGISTTGLVNAIDFARNNGAHVISNSWGFTNANNPNHIPAIRDAIVRATTLGRSGLGSVVVFSAGNSANQVSNDPGVVLFPSNVTVPGVLTVGASERDNFQANYSPTGNPNIGNNQIIDIVAPSHRAYSYQIPNETFEVWSIDIPGGSGYNPVPENDGGTLPVVGSVLPNAGVGNLSFTGRFGGTSAACPQVAAVAALILSVRPNITQQEVFNILTQTADQVGGYVYTNGQSNELGFGKLNACRALAGAATVSGPATVCTTGQFSVGNLPAASTITWSSSNSSGLSINTTTGLATRVNGYNGPVILTANITNGCGVAQISHSIWVGTPQITNQRVDNGFYSPGMAICPGNHWLNVTPIGGNPGNASWTVPSGIAHWVGNNTLDFTYPQNYSSSLTITVRASNTCGQGGNYNFFLSKKTFGCTSGFTMVAFPNPTTDHLTVEMMPVSPDVSKLDAPLIESAILYNTDGIEVANGKKHDGTFVFNVRGLKKGTYFIHVLVDGDLTREQIIIE